MFSNEKLQSEKEEKMQTCHKLNLYLAHDLNISSVSHWENEK